MTDNGIIWEDPPAARKRGGRHGAPRKWVPRLTPLIERPKVWAKVEAKPDGEKAGAVAHALRHSRSVVLPPGRWEFTSRTLANGTGAIYARYLGPEDGAE